MKKLYKRHKYNNLVHDQELASFDERTTQVDTGVVTYDSESNSLKSSRDIDVDDIVARDKTSEKVVFAKLSALPTDTTDYSLYALVKTGSKLYRYEGLDSNEDPVFKEYLPVTRHASDSDWLLKYNSANNTLETSEDVSVNDINVANRLIVEGDTFLNGNVIARKTVTIQGDLVVDGTQYITDSSTLDTTSDYLVLRQNAVSGLGNLQYAGIVVQNYDGNGSNLTFGTGNHGVLRVSQNTEETTTNYTLFSKVETDSSVAFYEGLTQDETKTVDLSGVITNRDEVEFSNCVYRASNKSYYHHDNVTWFELTLDSQNVLGYDIDNPVTDATLVAELDALTQVKLTWYRRLSVMNIDASQNQAIATRDEAENLPDNTLLKWNATEKKLEAIDVQPILNNQALVAQISKASSVEAVIAVSLDESSKVVIEPSGTEGTITTADRFDKQIVTDGSDWYCWTSDGSSPNAWYKVASFDSENLTVEVEDTAVTDTDLIAVLDSGIVYFPMTGTVSNPGGKVSYKWGSAGGGGNLVFATRAEYEAALAIAEGEEGYIGDGYQVTIEEEQDYVTTEEQE